VVGEYINLLIVFGIRKKYLNSGRRELFYLLVRRVMEETVVITEAYNSY